MRLLTNISLVCLSAWLVGCGSQAQQVENRQTAAQSHQEGVASFSGKDYPAAQQQLTAAIEAGDLPVDLYVDAHVKRAVANAVLGDYDQAHADLDKMEQGALDLDVVFAARSFVLEKEGKQAASKAAWSEARRINN